MTYRIRALKNGECSVRDYISFHDGGEETRTYILYVWLIEGGPQPMLVETGVTDVQSFNAGVERYIPGGVRQRPEERTVPLLASAGVRPEEVSHVFITHFHPDHYDSFHLFPTARMVASRKGFPESGLIPRVAEALRARGPEGLRLVGDEEILPGIRTFHLGVHSDCSMGIAVDTSVGRVVLPGDVVYLYDNLEPRERAPGWVDAGLWAEAARKVRAMGDLVLPGHDPEVLCRWPGGVIG